jgi:hypothetical protein
MTAHEIKQIVEEKINRVKRLTDDINIIIDQEPSFDIMLSLSWVLSDVIGSFPKSEWDQEINRMVFRIKHLLELEEKTIE